MDAERPTPPPTPFLERVRLRHYKSIAACEVELRPLTVLVERNGAGKSNFLDALAFVTESLTTSLDHAIKTRGGIDEVRRRSTGHPHNFTIDLDLRLTDGREASYGFELTSRKGGGFAVNKEKLSLAGNTAGEGHLFIRDGGNVLSSETNLPPVSADRLFLVNAAGLPVFRPVYDALTSMGFYNLAPEAMKELQSPDAGELLRPDGSNVASVVARLNDEATGALGRIREYLARIVPGITGLERVALGPKETLQFFQKVKGAEHPWRFYAASMSDGTLRALGALVAVAQLASADRKVRLIGIEEPETALHPAAAGALVDALREASVHTQVLVTTHSPDLLDQVTEDDGLLVVVSEEAVTRLAPIGPASRRAIREHPDTPGELLRLDRLEPDAEDLARQDSIRFFSELQAAS